MFRECNGIVEIEAGRVTDSGGNSSLGGGKSNQRLGFQGDAFDGKGSLVLRGAEAPRCLRTSNDVERKIRPREYNLLAMATVTLPTEIQPRSPQGEFRNEPFTDFKNPENARMMRAALDLVGSQLGHEYDLIIGGHRSRTEGKIKSLQPGAAGAGGGRAPEGRGGAR